MANIRKTFNFRNGVQVDEDNFIVDALGKVGIGTTVPTQMIDCRGDAKFVGIITSQSIETRNVNVSGVTTFSGDTHVGAAITFYPSSGIISATSIRGDGRNLINIPTSQWTDINAGLGFTSIYNSGFVGVSTNDPRFTLQVGGNNDLTTFANGVGINSTGGIVATGIVTAANFKGDVEGASIVGNLVGNVNSSGLSTVGTVRFDAGHVYNVLSVGSTSLNISGISTFKDDVELGGASGVTSVTWDKSANSLIFKDHSQAVFGDSSDLKISHNGSDSRIEESGTGSLILLASTIDIKNASGSDAMLVGYSGSIPSLELYYGGVKKVETRQEGIQVTGIASAGQFTGNVNAGVATVTSTLDLGGVSKLGVQTSTPQSQFHVFNAGISSVQVESGSNAAVLSLGTNVNKQQTSGEIVYGKNGLTYSDTGSLDVINYNNSHLNNIIHLGTQAGINTGSWNWIYGKAQSAPKMTLTYEGNLGIGKTNAAQPLDVVGNANVSNNLTVGGNGTVSSNLTVTGNLTVNGSNNISIAGKNLDVTTGHSKVKNLDITNNLTVSGFTTYTSNVAVGGTFVVSKYFNVNADGHVAIGTESFANGGLVGVDARHTSISASGVGIGTTSLKAAVDFSNAGRPNYDTIVNPAETNRMYMYPPKVTTAERNALQGVTAGALIYNTNTNKLQCHNGSGWQDCF